MNARTLLSLFALVGCAVEPDPAAPALCRSAARPGCPTSPGATVDPLQHLGRANTNTFFEITDILAHGDLALVCSGVRGFSVFDTSQEVPQLLVERVSPGAGLSNSQFPRCQHVGFDPDTSRVVITNRGDEVQPTPWLAIYNLADPSRPQLLGSWSPVSGSIEGVAIRGNRIFAALHGHGLVALELADGDVVETGRVVEEGTDAWQPVLRDDLLALADGGSGLRLFDVSERDPRLLSTVALQGSSHDVLLEDDRAYVVTSSGISIVDVADTSAAALLAEQPVSGTALDVALLGPRQIVVAQWDSLRGYDFTEPADPVSLFSETVPTDDSFSRVLAVGAVAARARVFGGEWTGLHAFAYSASAGPEVDLSPSSLQFGNVQPSDSDARVLLISNSGTRPLTVHDVTGSADVTVDETCFVVEPGRSKAVEVQLSPGSSASLQSAIRVCSDDPDEPRLEVPLTANVPGLAVGDPAPSFALRDLEGNTWTHADLEGKVAVLAYFATF
ncbi:MAG: choice-of-anchor D domain-containing protein [Nannocystales bacterium]